MNNELMKLMEQSRNISWSQFGKKISFYHPGMFWYNGSWGEYPAISITGKDCMLQCDHCKAKILEPMISVSSSEELLNKCIQLEEKGNKGCLISGGSKLDGMLPWNDFISGIEKVKNNTNLHLSIHCGIIDETTALQLKKAGVDQALIDVIGDDATLQKVYHCDFGIEKIEESLFALKEAEIPIIPHIVIGLNYGKITGEYKAVELVKKYQPEVLTFVSIMPLKDTPMQNISLPTAEEIAHVIASARKIIPDIPFSLGCARDRSNSTIDMYAIKCGINRMALPSDEAIEHAKKYGLSIHWDKTCCSLKN